MAHKEIEARVVGPLSIDVKRFGDKLFSSLELHKFCMNLTKSPRVTGKIIQRLASIGINE